MTTSRFRKPYREFERRPFIPDPVSRTKQSFADECEINNIMAKFQQTGVINHAAKHQATYGQADGTTFQEAMNIVIEAQEAFSDLPSSLRSRFGNDPAAYLNFVSNEENYPEMERLGLLNRAYAEEDSLPSNTGETERISTPEGGTVDPT
ncbi:hypothetical protein OAM66_03175 [Pelagibacteraceae bacterium]|jgi:phage internal scaffolding protein|nr:hypothetical protein [Pelagibacteraceae bacterium]